MSEDERQGKFQLIHYETADCATDFTLDPSNETVWATQQQIADAFGISTSTVRGHLTNIFKDGELDEKAVAREFRATGSDGKLYRHLAYSLDAILSVGYRVSSKRATAFRRWANQTLKEFLTKGFALNETLLRKRPEALRELAARVRALRSDELSCYEGVRDTFAFASTDYDKSSDAARQFFAKLQDKFLYAVTGQVASQIIIQRANHTEPNMGLQSMKGKSPTQSDTRVGKNYLDQDELYQLRILSEQFLLFIESRAMRGLPLTMLELSAKFDELLRIQGHEIFEQYPPYYTRDRANAHADKELIAFKQQRRRLQ